VAGFETTATVWLEPAPFADLQQFDFVQMHYYYLHYDSFVGTFERDFEHFGVGRIVHSVAVGLAVAVAVAVVAVLEIEIEAMPGSDSHFVVHSSGHSFAVIVAAEPGLVAVAVAAVVVAG